MDRVDKINDILTNWIHESLADLIGLHLLGPAHMLSYVNWIQPMGEHNIDDPEHPCDSYRAKLMIRCLEILGWQDILKAEAATAWDTAQKISQLYRIPSPDFRFNAATECLLHLEPYLFKVARDICSGATYQPEVFVSSKNRMLDLLKRSIPPVETLGDDTGGEFRPFDVVSILNAGWVFYEKGFPTWEERFPSLSLVERAELLNRLLAKAMELSFVKEAYSSVSKG